MRAQRPQQRTLVVHDQDAPHDAHSSVRLLQLCDRETDHHRDAPARRVLDGQLAADRVDETPRDRETETDTGVARGVAEALERLEDALSLRERNPATAVDDAEVDAAGHDGRLDPDRACPGPSAGPRCRRRSRPLVRASAGSTSTQRQGLGDVDDDAARGVAQARERGRHDLVEPGGPARELERARLQPAHVEQVLDELVEPVGLGVDAAHELVGVGARPVDVGLQPSARQRLDRRERRAQVVAHGREQRVRASRSPATGSRPCSPPLAGGASRRSRRGTRAARRRGAARRRAAAARSSRARDRRAVRSAHRRRAS